MHIDWHKYHALKNDFLVIESPKGSNRRFCGKIAEAICDRHTGIGADGILVVGKGKRITFVNVYNADGSWAEISGNGARIAAFHRVRQGSHGSGKVIMGGKSVRVVVRSTSKVKARVLADIATPIFSTKDIPVRSKKRVIIQSPVRIGGLSIPMTILSVGNPHAVLFVDSFDFDWPSVGQLIETAKIFPNRTNVEFVRVATPTRLEVRLWERGVGMTGSSGTGAAASLAAAVVTGRARRTATVVSPAGSLKVSWKTDTNVVSIDGPVNFVGSGSFELS
ncbi:MAG: diaminopimelate epimerase [Candidatus Zixiibacteriota bacterium]